MLKYEQLENFEKPYLIFCFKTYFKKCSVDIRFWQSRTRFQKQAVLLSRSERFPPKTPNQKEAWNCVDFWWWMESNSSPRVRCLLIFVWERSGVQFLCLGKIHTTSTIVVCLVRFGRPGFWSVFVSWELNRTGIKALNLSKKESGWSSSSDSSGDHRPHMHIYIIRFFSTIKYMKYNYTHTSSQKLKVYEKDFAFFFPYSQKQLLKKTFNRRPMSCQPLRTADLKMWKDSRKSAAKILSPFTCLRWFFAKTGKPKTVWL